jgi:hypothetical protein
VYECVNTSGLFCSESTTEGEKLTGLSLLRRACQFTKKVVALDGISYAAKTYCEPSGLELPEPMTRECDFEVVWGIQLQGKINRRRCWYARCYRCYVDLPRPTATCSDCSDPAQARE